ncbi:MAG: hypothetical protein AB7I27_05050 [Bacteriovoracaceae bacterium]
MFLLKKLFPYQCSNHLFKKGEASCVICQNLFCDKCIIEEGNLHFCREHHFLFQQKKWTRILSITSSASEPELGVELYELKNRLYTKHSIPTYVETHYKEIENSVETILDLWGPIEEANYIREFFKDIKKGPEGP